MQNHFLFDIYIKINNKLIKYMFLEKVPEEKENPTNQEYRFEYIGDEI